MSNYLKNQTDYEIKFLCETHGEKKVRKICEKINSKLCVRVRAECLKKKKKK